MQIIWKLSSFSLNSLSGIPAGRAWSAIAQVSYHIFLEVRSAQAFQAGWLVPVYCLLFDGALSAIPLAGIVRYFGIR